jgi:FkbM family methyltransferase
MSALEAIRSYYSLFGSHGVLLGAKARLLRRSTEAIVEVPGIRSPVHVRLRTTDLSTLRQVLVIAEYDCEFSRPIRVIVDAGANIGLTSVYYANKYPEATIIAIEPEPSNYRMLEENTAPYPNVTLVRGALWKSEKEISILDPGVGHYGFQTRDEPESDNANRRGRVAGITVDKLMQRYSIDHIDILKLDIEGAEKEVFETSFTWINKVGVIIVELHDRFKIGCSRSVYEAVKEFNSEFRKGETVFLAKKEYVLDRPPQPYAQEELAETSSSEPPIKLPMRILRSV